MINIPRIQDDPIYIKGKQVVNSCKNIEQAKIAQKYLNLMKQRLKKKYLPKFIHNTVDGYCITSYILCLTTMLDELLNSKFGNLNEIEDI